MTPTDQKILAVVSDGETSSHVLEAALERAEQERAPLVVLHVMPLRVYDTTQQLFTRNRDLAHHGFTLTHTQARDSARTVARRAAQAVIGDRDVSYTTVGEVGGLVSTVLAVAAANDCRTIFLPETGSWFRRVIGRTDSKIASRFDGTVVQVPRSPPENLKMTRSLPVE